MAALTPEIRRRLDKIIQAGYMVKPGQDYTRLLLTDKGMAVLFACADSPVQIGDLVKPSLADERLRTNINLAWQQGIK